MAMASSASFTAKDSASAVLWTCTVLMPSSCAARMMRTAISPRLAMRSFFSATPSRQFGQRLAGHDGVLVVGQEFHDLARLGRLHLVEGLHHFDEADDVADRDSVTLVLVDRLVG